MIDNNLERSKASILPAYFARSWTLVIIGLVFIAFCANHLADNGAGSGAIEVVIASLVYFCFFLLLLKIKNGRRDFIWKLLCVVFCLKVLLALLNYSTLTFPPTQDALKNNEMALELSSAWSEGQFIFSFSRPVEPAYVIPMAIVYFIFGYNLYLGCLFNILAATAAIYFVYKIAILLFGQREAIIASIVYSGMPNLNFMSFFLNREIIIIFLMVTISYLIILWLREKELKHKFALPALCLYLALLRPENIIVVAPYCVLIYILKCFKESKSLLLPIKVAAILMALTIGSCILFNYLSNNSELLRLLHLSRLTPEHIYNRPLGHTHFGLAYLPEEPPGSWFELTLSYGPWQALNFLLRPFPGDIFRSNQIFLVFNNFILYILYVFGILGLLRLTFGSSMPYFVAVFSFLFSSIFAAGLVQGNGFAAARHREQFIFFIYILASSGTVTLWQMAVEAARNSRSNTQQTGNPEILP